MQRTSLRLLIIAAIALLRGSPARVHGRRPWRPGFKTAFRSATESHSQSGLRSWPDGCNGAIVIWTERRFGNETIYAQRVNGFRRGPMDPDGLPVLLECGPAVGLDGLTGPGGAVRSCSGRTTGTEITTSTRCGFSAQGLPLWTTDGVPLAARPAMTRLPSRDFQLAARPHSRKPDRMDRAVGEPKTS